MSSPIPPDPYAALGVAKDVDLSAIRTAHRKLVLKFHPDRIKDEALKEKGKNEFQKIQQAYELLVDPAKRSRYDDQVKLAELRKEAMMRDNAPRSATYPMRGGPPPTPKSAAREFREDGRFYEERVPVGSSPSYFDSKDRFDEPIRTASRKHADYDRKPSASKSSAEKDKRAASGGFFAAATAASFTVKMKKEVEKQKAKARERDSHAAKKEARDREKRRNRSEKDDRRSPYVVDASDSDSDGATQVTSSTIKPSRSSPHFRPEPESPRKRYSAPTRSLSDDDDGESYDKWERHYESSIDYIGRASNRPSYERTVSEAPDYWVGKVGGSGRKSGSDSDRRPTSSKGRQSYEEPRLRPSLPTQSSAPSNLRPHLEERIPSSQRRAATASYPRRDRDREPGRDRDRDRERDQERDSRTDMPTFSRSQTMPSPKISSKKDNAPSKGSNLKHAETHDSGYGSSNPNTPEMREESPIRSSRGAQTSYKYQIVEPENEHEQRRTVRLNRVLDDEADRHRRYRSPEADKREPDRRESDRREPERRESDRRDPDRRREKSDRSERPRADAHIRTRSNRDSPSMQEIPVPPATRRTESARYARESPPLSRNNSTRDKLFGEMSGSEGEGQRHRRQYSNEKISTTPRYNDIKFANHRRDHPDQRSNDYAQGSRFEDNLRYPEMGSRRGSVY